MEGSLGRESSESKLMDQVLGSRDKEDGLSGDGVEM